MKGNHYHHPCPASSTAPSSLCCHGVHGTLNNPNHHHPHHHHHHHSHPHHSNTLPNNSTTLSQMMLEASGGGGGGGSNSSAIIGNATIPACSSFGCCPRWSSQHTDTGHYFSSLGNNCYGGGSGCYLSCNPCGGGCPSTMVVKGHQRHHNQSTRVLSLMALSLIFILIWSTVLSSVFIIHSFREQQSSNNMLELFALHKHVGQLAFNIGNEMVSSLSLLETNNDGDNLANHNNNSNSRSTRSSSSSLSTLWLKQNETDSMLQIVIDRLQQKGFDNCETIIKERLQHFRAKCGIWAEQNTLNLNETNLQIDGIDGVRGQIRANRNTENWPKTALDCIYTFERMFYTLDTILLQDNQWLSEKYSKLSLVDFSLRDLPYTLFVRGLVHRFTSLGLGFMLVRSNFDSHQTFNITEYFHYHYSSRQQIESSFLWNLRFYQKYLELEQSEYQSEILLEMFNKRFRQQQESYSQMSQIFHKMFNEDSLDRIHILIKKKNAESIERLLVNGSNAKYVTDLDASNQVAIQVDTEFLESFGLKKIQKIIEQNHQHQHYEQRPAKDWSMQVNNLTRQYDEMMRNQIRFLIRVQDFLNISIYSHLAQSTLSEQNNFVYHCAVVAMLIGSILLTIILFSYMFVCKQQRPNCCCCPTSTMLLMAGHSGKSILNRRVARHRRFWHLTSSSPKSTFKTYFSSSANHHHHHHHHQQSKHQQLQLKQKPVAHHYHSSSLRNPLLGHNKNIHAHHHHCPYHRSMMACSSPNTFMVSSHTKRTFAGNIINRVCATPLASLTGPNSQQTNSPERGTKTAMLTYKLFDNSNNRNSNKPATTANIATAATDTDTTTLASNDLRSDKKQQSSSVQRQSCCHHCQCCPNDEQENGDDVPDGDLDTCVDDDIPTTSDCVQGQLAAAQSSSSSSPSRLVKPQQYSSLDQPKSAKHLNSAHQVSSSTPEMAVGDTVTSTAAAVAADKLKIHSANITKTSLVVVQKDGATSTMNDEDI